VIKIRLICDNEKCADYTEEIFVKMDSENTLEMCHIFCRCCGMSFKKITWVPVGRGEL